MSKFSLDNQLSLCTVVCAVEGELTYIKFVFTVLVTEPKSEKQMVLVEMEKICVIIHLFINSFSINSLTCFSL